MVLQLRANLHEIYFISKMIANIRRSVILTGSERTAPHWTGEEGIRRRRHNYKYNTPHHNTTQHNTHMLIHVSSRQHRLAIQSGTVRLSFLMLCCVVCFLCVVCFVCVICCSWRLVPIWMPGFLTIALVISISMMKVRPENSLQVKSEKQQLWNLSQTR